MLGRFQSSKPMQSPEEFRAAIRAKYPEEFLLCQDVAAILEQAVKQPRRLVNEVARVADMLMVQAYKAHASVYFLAVRAQIEDAATITRRLLEIAVQAIYITGDSDPEVCKQRAGRYLAHLWASIPDEWRTKMPIEERTAWETYYQSHQHLLPAKRRSWGPNFRSMFQEIGHVSTYERDYSLLSRIAHGAPPSLVQDYAQLVVPLRSDTFVPTILIFASRYYLAVAGQWNDIFHLANSDELVGLVGRAMRFFSEKEASGSSPSGGAT